MTRRDWFGELEPSDEHPVSLEVERRLAQDEKYRKLCDRILEVGTRLGDILDGEAAHLWLEVEAALNDRCDMSEVEYYNAGVDAGLARATEDLLAGPRPPVAATLRALAAVLERVATLLD